MKKYTLLFLFFMVFQQLFAQYDESVNIPFLLTQQSPLLQGAGGIGAAVPMTEAFGFYYNPAQLGYFARENNFSAFFMPDRTGLFGSRVEYPGINAAGITAGYNFKTKNNNLPLTIGFGYLHSTINYGDGYYPGADNLYTKSTNPGDSYDSFNTLSLGAGYEYYLLFNIGFAVKPYSRFIKSDHKDIGEKTHNRNSTAFDFGALIVVPITQLIFGDRKKASSEESDFLIPDFDFSLGYSLTNAGKKFSQYGYNEPKPVPGTARLGYSLHFNLESYTNEENINVLDYTFTVEAEDLLQKCNPYTDSIDYYGIIGDIKFGKNLIEVKPEKDIILHRGHIINLAETVIVTFGCTNYRSVYSMGSTGYGISSKGLLKMFSELINVQAVNYISRHLVLEYYNSTSLTNSFYEANYQGLAFYLKGIEL